MSRTNKVLALSIGEGLNLVLGFLLIPYLARAMSLEDNGTYGQVILVVSTVVRLLSFGFNKVLFTELASKKNAMSTTFISNLFLVLCFGVLGMFSCIVFNEQIGDYMQNSRIEALLLIYCFSIPFTLIKSSFDSMLIYLHKVKETVIVSVSTNAFRLLGIFYFIQFDYNLDGVFIILLLVPVIQVVLLIFFMPKQFLFEGKIDRSSFLIQLKDGIPLGFTIMISTIFYSVDGFMVSQLLGTEKFAIFRNGAIYIPVVASLYGAVNTIVLPDVAKLYSSSMIEELTNLKRKALHNTAGIIYPIVIFFVVFSSAIIPFLLSEKYAESYLVFSIFNLALLFRITSYDDIYIASRKSSKLPFRYGMAMICNILLNYLLITLYGVNGAALATLFSFILLVILLISGSTSILSIKLSDLIDFRKLLKSALIPFLVAGALSMVYLQFDYLPLVIVFFIIYCLIVYHSFLKSQIIDPTILSRLLSRFLKEDNLFLLKFKAIYH